MSSAAASFAAAAAAVLLCLAAAAAAAAAADPDGTGKKAGFKVTFSNAKIEKIALLKSAG